MGSNRSQIAIRVSVPDPQHPGAVETKIIIDDRFVVLEAFTAGPAERPEYLLGPEHRLHAEAEPHEVRLAEADCTEGCCGALYVTIERRGDEVVWRDWRNPDQSGLSLPTFCFDAGQYDGEIERAESDHSWEWHDRTAARLVRERLRQEPGPLAAWECHFGWAEARPNDRGHLHVSYFYPRPPEQDQPWLQFVAILDVSDGDPAGIADEVLSQLTQRDPRQQRWLSGGSQQAADELGFAWQTRP